MNKDKKKKEKEVLELISIISNYETIYLIDISNLSSNQISFLRKRFHDHDIRMKVVKNTLLKKSLEKIESKKLDSFFSILKGNTTLLFSNFGIGNMGAKIIKKFHIQEQIEIPYLKVAYVQESFYFGNKDLEKIINIKSKEDLIIDILKTLRSPILKIVLSFLKSTENRIFGILESLSSIKKK
ncbi:50S ribosomal protein L10 [Blattabacterium cuenoti]|uniref:50S ribosomal protein L10 n=1 Tax=Blattabacterium cuenoti TaxID=1653831 RepID=UPI00163CE954|nr:50S ribosomal protein L10 [Blattabacterium cuenoti]